LEEQSLKPPSNSELREGKKNAGGDLTVETDSCSAEACKRHGIISRLSFVQLFRLMQACAESARRVTVEWKIVEF